MKKFIKIMTGFMNRMAQDHVSAFAAQAAFFILMSFVPFLMLLLPLVTYVSITKDMVVEMILQVMPDAGDFRSFLLSIIQEVYDKSTAVVPISAIFTLWSAGKGLQGLTGKCDLPCKRDKKLCGNQDPVRFVYAGFYPCRYRKSDPSGIW